MSLENWTLFSIPKGFEGRFQVIQTNAIRSWALLQPRPEIILFGDDRGTVEMARELGLRHEPEMERNEFGTPLVKGIFEKAQRLASHNLMCYVNADIILTRDFTAAWARGLAEMRGQRFLMVGRKKNLELEELLGFEPGWEERLRRLAKSKGQYVTPDSDYFAFPRWLYSGMPAFAIGRCFWSAWLVYEAKRQGVPVLDATSEVLAIESKHDYSHATSTGGARRLSGAEYKLNGRLFKGCRYYTTVDATHVLTATGLRPADFWCRLRSWRVRSSYFLYFLLKAKLYPYSLPLIIPFRWGRALWKALVGLKRLALPSWG